MMNFFDGKKVLVAGGTGLVGIPTCCKLVEQGASVTVVSIDSDEWAKLVLPSEVSFLRLDLQTYDHCASSVKNQDIVINLLASKGNATLGNSKICETYIPFLRFNTNLMEAAFREGVDRFMFVGSICEYPNLPIRSEDDVWKGLPIANDKYAGIAKRAGELQGEAYMLQYGWNAVKIIRPSNIYGPYDDFSSVTGQVIPALISRIVNGENPLLIRGGKHPRRDFIYVDDVVDGLLVSLEKAPPCVPINIGSGEGCTIEDLVKIIIKNIVTKPNVTWLDSLQGDNVRILDVQRAKKLINFTPQISLSDGVNKTIKWYMENRVLLRDKQGA